MREIKFRAWDKIDRTMLNDLPIIDFEVCKINGLTLMQYTGLQDKNGKDIYEGDVVKSTGMIVPDIVSVVEWGTCYAHSLGDDSTEMHGWVVKPQGYDAEPLFPFSNLEVIGDIHSNPELLEV